MPLKPKVEKPKAQPALASDNARPRTPRKKQFLGRLKGKIRIVGDIVSPVESPDAWQCDLNNLDSKPQR